MLARKGRKKDRYRPDRRLENKFLSPELVPLVVRVVRLVETKDGREGQIPSETQHLVAPHVVAPIRGVPRTGSSTCHSFTFARLERRFN